VRLAVFFFTKDPVSFLHSKRKVCLVRNTKSKSFTNFLYHLKVSFLVSFLASPALKSNEHDCAIAAARAERKQRSRDLLQEMRDTAFIMNFRGRALSLSELWAEQAGHIPSGTGGMPSGFGECCAPKLLNFCARKGLKPLALVEMWWGRPPPGGGRATKKAYGSCIDKCSHILGFSLCGLVDRPPKD
jgi:hypothetical protein